MTDVFVYWATSVTEAPDLAFRLFANDNFTTSIVADMHLVGQDSFVGTDDFISTSNGAGTWFHLGHISDLQWWYTDEDQTGEFHIQVVNEMASTAIVAGDMAVELIFHPEVSR